VKKTALKRLKKSNPKGNRKPKLIYKESSQGHLKTKKRAAAKRAKSSSAVVDKTIVKKYRKIVSI